MKISSKLAGSLSSIICWPKILWLLSHGTQGRRPGPLHLPPQLRRREPRLRVPPWHQVRGGDGGGVVGVVGGGGVSNSLG